MRELRLRGVAFEEYDFPGLKTVDGIAEIGGNYASKGIGERGAWFRDSEGNLLEIRATGSIMKLARPSALFKRLATCHCATATAHKRSSINVGQGLASPVREARGAVGGRDGTVAGGQGPARLRMLGRAAAFRQVFSGAPQPLPTRSRARSKRTGAAPRSGTSSSVSPGKIEDGTSGDRANEHYHRYKEDVALIKELGCKAYRFSVAWPQFPDGDGKPNPKGLDFYNRLVDELLKNGIEPWLTLYHWDLPQSLQDRFGGWRSTETCKIFRRLRGLCRRTPDRPRQERVHAERESAASSISAMASASTRRA